MSGTWKVSSGGWSSGVSIAAPRATNQPIERANSPRRPPSPLLRPPSPLCRGGAAPTNSTFPRAPAPAAPRQSSLRGHSPILRHRSTDTQHKGVIPPQWPKTAAAESFNNTTSFSFPQGFSQKSAPTNFADEAEYARKAVSRWVTVYSLDSGDTLVAIQYLTSTFGPVKRYYWPAAGKNCNWLHIEFYDPIAASAALAQHHISIQVASAGGGQIVEFAVEGCREHVIVNSFLEEDLEDYRTHKSLVETEESEIAEAAAEAPKMDEGDDFEVPRDQTAAARLSLMRQRVRSFKSGALTTPRIQESTHTSNSRSIVLPQSNVVNSSVSRGVRSNLTLFGGVTSTVSAVSAAEGCSRDVYRAEIRNRDVPIPIAESKMTKATAADLWTHQPIVPYVVSVVCEQLSMLRYWGADAPKIRRRAVAERVGRRLIPAGSDAPIPIADADTSLNSAEHECDVDAVLYRNRGFLSGVRRSLKRHFVYRLPQQETVCSPTISASNVYIILRPRPWYINYTFWVSLFLTLLFIVLFYFVALYPLMAVASDWWSEVRVVLFGEASSAPGGSFYYYMFSGPSNTPSGSAHAIFSKGGANAASVEVDEGGSYKM